MASKTYAIMLDGVEYRVTAREIIDISTIITGITPTTAEYTGEHITVTPVSTSSLQEYVDYEIFYSDNINVGLCDVTIYGLGDYEGSVSFTLEITEVEPGPEPDSDPEPEPEPDPDSES